MATEIEKLEKNIATLEEVDEDSPKLAKMRAKLKELKAEGGASAPSSDDLELDMTEDEYADVATGFSNRPVAGDYAAEIGTPELNYSEKAMKIPFTIIETGPWKGFDGDAFYPSKSSTAAFSIKNIIKSAGLREGINPKTKKVFLPISQLPGRKITVVYKDETSEFTGNDGITRMVTKAKVKHAKPFYEKPTKII